MFLSKKGTQRILWVSLLPGNDSSLVATLGSLQSQEIPGRPGTQSGPKARSAQVHQELSSPGFQRIHSLKVQSECEYLYQISMVRKVQQCESIHRFFFRLRAAIHKIFRRQTQSRFLSCFDPCLSAETRLMLHHKRALQTRIIKLCSGAAAILVYIFFTFLITFSFLFLLLLHFNLKRTTCFKLYT